MALFKTSEQKQADEAVQAERAFWYSPPGQARLAHQRGDQVFQLAIQLSQQKATIVPMAGALTNADQKDSSTELNEVIREGWDLITGSVAFVQTGSESRDKLMASGQNLAVSGHVTGYYLFRRRETLA
ncbi:MAG: hypothetical protein LH624_00100 [Cryobacterium sp.]|nr:hypothetical protein [Cryobacterium sp.]